MNNKTLRLPGFCPPRTILAVSNVVVVAIAQSSVFRLCPILLIGLSLLLSSCAGRKALLAGGTRCIVTTSKAPFFKNGPAQGGSDLDLKKGERVTLVSTKLGFCYVKTEDGALGYIADDQLTPAPPEPPVTPKVVGHFAAVNPAMPNGGFEELSAAPLFGTATFPTESDILGPDLPREENEPLPPLPGPARP